MTPAYLMAVLIVAGIVLILAAYVHWRGDL
jgi:hypothetical protein